MKRDGRGTFTPAPPTEPPPDKIDPPLAGAWRTWIPGPGVPDPELEPPIEWRIARRDLFIAGALAGILARVDETPTYAAHQAIDLADAVIAEDARRQAEP